MRELRNSNGFNLDWLVLIDLYLVTIWLIFEIDQSDSSWPELADVEIVSAPGHLVPSRI